MSDAHFRRSARSPIDLRVQFRRDEPGAALSKVGRVSDLGMGGAFVTCDGEVPTIGTRVRVVITLPTAWDPLELPAEVRWHRETALGEVGFGVRFVGLSTSQAGALYELVSRTGFSEPSG